MNRVMYYLPSLRQYLLFVFGLFAIAVLADSTLEITDDLYVDELYDQAGTWRKQIVNEYNWRATEKEEQGRIEWGEDYSTYQSEEDDFMSSELETNGPKPATILRIRF